MKCGCTEPTAEHDDADVWEFGVEAADEGEGVVSGEVNIHERNVGANGIDLLKGPVRGVGPAAPGQPRLERDAPFDGLGHESIVVNTHDDRAGWHQLCASCMFMAWPQTASSTAVRTSEAGGRSPT